MCRFALRVQASEGTSFSVSLDHLIRLACGWAVFREQINLLGLFCRLTQNVIDVLTLRDFVPRGTA